MSLDDDLAKLDQLLDHRVIDQWQPEDMRALLFTIDEHPNPVTYRYTFDRVDRYLLALAELPLDDQRVDSPESDGEGSREGLSFDCCEDDEQR